MSIILMLTWWYTDGWLQNIQTIERRLKNLGHIFAVKVLLRTWFSPWKQIHRQSTFATFFRDAADNALSRIIGGIIRTFILFGVLIMAIGIVIIGGISLIIWPLVPLLGLPLIYLAVTGVHI